MNALDFYPGTTLRSGVTFRFSPQPCGGVAVTWPAQPGDAFEYSDFVVRGGAPPAQASPRPARTTVQHGYASGLDPRLDRVRMRFSDPGGGPITVGKCSDTGSPRSSSPSPSP